MSDDAIEKILVQHFGLEGGPTVKEAAQQIRKHILENGVKVHVSKNPDRWIVGFWEDELREEQRRKLNGSI